MQSKPEASRESGQAPEFAEPVARKPLVLLRDAERSLRVKTVDAIVPLLPEKAATNLGEASLVADESLARLAEVDLDAITDEDLRPARMQVGMLFLGFGALTMTFLLMVELVLHSDWSVGEQVQHFWHQYIWFVGLGVSGLFMIGREAMRPFEGDVDTQSENDDWVELKRQPRR